MATIYELKRYHHKREYRKGDLEADTVQDFSQNFKTRTEANNFIENKAFEARRNNWTAQLNLVKRGDKSSTLYVFTGDKWFNEGTGETEEEYYQYIVKKINL